MTADTNQVIPGNGQAPIHQPGKPVPVAGIVITTIGVLLGIGGIVAIALLEAACGADNGCKANLAGIALLFWFVIAPTAFMMLVAGIIIIALSVKNRVVTTPRA